MNLIYLFLLITIILFIIPKIILIYFVPKNIRRNIDQIINFDSKNTAYSMSNKSKNTIGDTFVHAPHPFTNWSLNPHTKYNEVLMHTKEGFRKTSNSNSILEELKYYNNECIFILAIRIWQLCLFFLLFFLDYPMEL